MSYTVSGLRQTISMTGEIGNQVAFLLMTIVLFAGLGMWFYNPKKNMKRTNLQELPNRMCWEFLFIVKQEAGTKVLASQLFWIVEQDAVVEWALLR